MNYEFHVGDYVETIGGAVGYIVSIDDDEVVWRCVCCSDGYQANFTYSTISSNRLNPNKFYRRIGAYDFTKKEKKKIEMISECNRGIFANTIKPGNHIARMVSNEIIDKINELVDAVNELRDKEDDE